VAWPATAASATARRACSAVVALMVLAACSSSESSEVAAPTVTASSEVVEPSVDPSTTADPTTTIATPAEVPVSAPEGMELVWSDEFDGTEIDPSNWTYDLGGGGWGNGEVQHYTDRSTNARVQNGLLVIELHQEKYEGSYYTSARLKTQGLREFQYGRIEARVKVPAGIGTWPAFWMLGANFDNDSVDPQQHWPNVGEIDVMEYVGREPDLVMGTVHGPGYAGAGGLTRWNRQDHPIADDFHTFAVEWDVDGIRWFYDDQMYYDLGREAVGQREWVFDHPFFLIVNLALGGTLGGNLALDLEFPIQYYVDYVRVYQPTGT
jgi:beta-glucanase (GH16 family)